MQSDKTDSFKDEELIPHKIIRKKHWGQRALPMLFAFI